MKQFLGFVLLFCSLSGTVLQAGGPLDPECTADARILLSGRPIPPPFKLWPYSQNERAKLLRSGIEFFKNEDPSENYFNHVRVRSPEIFEMIGAILTHTRIGDLENENCFVTGGPIFCGPSRKDLKKAVARFIYEIPARSSWLKSIFGGFNAESYLSNLKLNLETLIHNLNYGSSDLKNRNSGFLKSFLSPVRIGQKFFFRTSEGTPIFYRVNSIDFDLGLLAVAPMNGADFSHIDLSGRKVLSFSDFYEGLSYEDRRIFFRENIGQPLPKEWGFPQTPLFSVVQKQTDSTGKVLYKISGSAEPRGLEIKAHLSRSGSKQDQKVRFRTWMLSNGFLEGQGFLIDFILDLFPSMAARLNWKRIERGKQWIITSVFDLVNELNSWDLALKMNTTPRFLGVFPEDYLRQLGFERAYSFGEQGTPFFHDQFVHLVGLALLPPEVFKGFAVGAQKLILALDASRKIDPQSAQTLALLKEVKNFGDYFDNQLYLIFEEFILEKSPELGVFKKGKLKERLAKIFSRLAQFPNKSFRENLNLGISEEANTTGFQMNSHEEFWKNHCEAHVTRILGPDGFNLNLQQGQNP